jgi:hypothetical protein
MSRAARLALALAIAAGLAAGVYYWRAAREIAVRTVPVESELEVRVFGIGSVEAQVVSKAGFQISGKLVRIEADQGDMVAAGQLHRGCRSRASNSVVTIFPDSELDVPTYKRTPEILRLDPDQTVRRPKRSHCARATRQIIMTLESAIILSAIVLAFAVFASALAWGDRRTRNLADSRT